MGEGGGCVWIDEGFWIGEWGLLGKGFGGVGGRRARQGSWSDTFCLSGLFMGIRS